MDENLTETNAELIQELWEEHQTARMPSGFASRDVNGISFELLDIDVTGCVSTFLQRGTLDTWRTASLGLCVHHCYDVLPILSEACQVSAKMSH